MGKSRTSLRDMDDDIEELFRGGPNFFHKIHQIHEVDFFIDEDVKCPSHYRGLLHYLHSMSENDSLRIWIDTYGGHLDSALAIIDAINNSEGNITVIVTGNAFSAGSLIALSAPTLIVGEMSRFQLHQGSYGTEGKHGDIEAHVNYSKKLLEKAMRSAYTDFLTEEELQLMMIGKEFYFDSNEVQERLEKRGEIQEKRAKDREKQEKKAKKPQE